MPQVPDCHFVSPNPLPTPYQHPTNSYHGRSWLGVGKEKVLISWLVEFILSGGIFHAKR